MTFNLMPKSVLDDPAMLVLIDSNLCFFLSSRVCHCNLQMINRKRDRKLLSKSTTIVALSCINTLIYCTFLYENTLIYCIQGCVYKKVLVWYIGFVFFVPTQNITVQTHNLREKIFHYKVFLVHTHWSYLLTDGPRWLLRNSHSAGLGKTGVLCKCYVIITMDRGSTSMI